MNIPPGYEIVKRANVLMAVRREHRDALVAVLTGADAGRPEAGMTGRVAHGVVTVGGTDGFRAVRKRYVRGGLFGGLLGGYYLGRGRALGELAVCDEAARRGAPVSEILAMKLTRVLPWVYRIEALIREIPGATNLRDFLAAERDAAVPRTRERRTAALRLAAGAVRALHDAAVIHGDLNMMNILIVCDDGGPRKAFIIDLDKSVMGEGVGLGPRLGNLSRLNRSAEKLAMGGPGISRLEKMRFLRRYFEGRMPEKKTLTAFLDECGRSLARHRALWEVPDAGAKAGGAL